MIKPILMSTLLLASSAHAHLASWYGGKFHGRTLDLSRGAFSEIADIQSGIVKVKITVVK